MISIDLNSSWDDGVDWQTLAEESINQAIINSDYKYLPSYDKNISISITLSNNDQLHALNKQYRGKDKATNILSFPMLEPNELRALDNHPIPEILLGDLILSHDICYDEAIEKNITIEEHYQHLIIHGILHLLGYDHIEDKDADIMQSIEITALHNMGINNPYERG